MATLLRDAALLREDYRVDDLLDFSGYVHELRTKLNEMPSGSLMGIVGRYPFALAAGLGINGVVAFQLASQMTWAAAMGVVVVVMTIIVATFALRLVFRSFGAAEGSR